MINYFIMMFRKFVLLNPFSSKANIHLVRVLAFWEITLENQVARLLKC